MINNDDIPLEISVQDDSKAIQAAGWDLSVTPSQATLQPNQKLPLDISVEAMRPGQLSRPIKIKCKHKSEPLLLYVKALAHAMVVEVILEDQLGRTRNLQSDQMNQIRFDAVELHENAIRTIHIGNVPSHKKCVGGPKDSSLAVNMRRGKWTVPGKVEGLLAKQTVLLTVQTKSGQSTFSRFRPSALIKDCSLSPN